MAKQKTAKLVSFVVLALGVAEVAPPDLVDGLGAVVRTAVLGKLVAGVASCLGKGCM